MDKFDALTKYIFEFLLKVYLNHSKLSERGKLKDKKNRFGDMALRADIEAEEIILKSLEQISKKENYKIESNSEELGENVINSDGKNTLFVVFDGLDGSSNYLHESMFGFGAMFALAKTKNPKYKDFIASGLVMMKEKMIVIAIKGRGLILYDIGAKKFQKIRKFNKSERFNDSKTLANKYFPEELEAYGEKPWVMTGSTAWSIFSMCTDKKFNALIEVTRKGNLEQPILYLMITELGGVMVNKNGKSIGNNFFKTWGQKGAGEEFLITAKNLIIAKQLLKSLSI